MSGIDERWIEAEAMTKEGDDVDAGFCSLFQDPDPYDTFQFEWTCDGNPIQLQLRGLKQELGQTLNSTGLTLWRASNILCDFLLHHKKDVVERKSILEVRFCG